MTVSCTDKNLSTNRHITTAKVLNATSVIVPATKCVSRINNRASQTISGKVKIDVSNLKLLHRRYFTSQLARPNLIRSAWQFVKVAKKYGPRSGSIFKQTVFRLGLSYVAPSNIL